MDQNERKGAQESALSEPDDELSDFWMMTSGLSVLLNLL